MSLVFLVLLLATNFYFGYELAVILRIPSQIERIGAAFLLGSGVMSLLFFWSHAIGNAPFNTITVVALHLLLFICVIFFRRKNKKMQTASCWSLFQKRSGLEKIIVFLIIFLLVGTAFINYVKPITDWDALALYDFRAKVMIATGSVDSGFDLGYFFQYPLYTSLLHTAAYALAIPQAKVWYSALYFSFILSFYALLHRKINSTLSLVGALALAISPQILEHATMAYANLPYTIFFVLGIFYLWYWFDQMRHYDLLLGFLFLGLSAWVRPEPFWILGAVIVFFGVCTAPRQKLKRGLESLYGLAIFFGLRSIWPQYVKYLETKVVVINQVSAPATSEASFSLTFSLLRASGMWEVYVRTLWRSISILPTQTVLVGQYLLGYVYPVFGYMALPILLSILVFYRRGFFSRFLYIQLLTMLLLAIMVFGGSVLFSLLDPSWDRIGGSASRVVMFVPPLLIFILMQSPLWQIRKKSA